MQDSIIAHDRDAETPPHSLEAEQATLGAALLDRDALARTIEELRAEDFYHDAHRVIFQAMVELFERGEPVDLITLTHHLADMGKLDDVGGPTYLASLPNIVPTTVNAGFYIGIVMCMSRRRALVNIALDLATRAKENGADPDALLAEAGQRFAEIARTGADTLPFETARALTRAAPPTVPWRAAPYLSDGALSELDGPIKTAGKTTFALDMARCILDGAPFLGRATARSPVVYLSEQPVTSFAAALRRAALADRDDLHILRFADVVGAPWATVADAAIRMCERCRAKVLVVDTLGRFANIPDDLENAAGAAQAAMAPLARAASAGLAVLVLRHDRKSGGDVGQSARGSTAFGGAVDMILALRRSSDSNNTDLCLRELHALSRFDETPPLVIVRYGTDGAYHLVGAPGDVGEDQAAARLLSAAPRNEGDAVTTSDLLAAAAVKRTVGYELLDRLRREGRIERAGTGKRRDPHRYWVAVSSAQVSSTNSFGEDRAPRTQRPSERFVRALNPIGRTDEKGGTFLPSADSSGEASSGGRTARNGETDPPPASTDVEGQRVRLRALHPEHADWITGATPTESAAAVEQARAEKGPPD